MMVKVEGAVSGPFGGRGSAQALGLIKGCERSLRISLRSTVKTQKGGAAIF